MEDNRTRSGTSEVTPSGPETADNHYEIDLDEHAPADIDEAIKDAVAAVDRNKDDAASETGTPDAGTPAAGTPAEASNRTAPEPEVAEREPDRGASGTDGSRPEAGDLRERLMRTLADFDNYRKRTEREKRTLRRFANFDVFKDFLGVLDNFERAMDSSGSAEDLKQGLKMIVRQHEEILRRHGVEQVESVGKPFDPTVHEAVAREESTEVEVPTVTREMQKGYLLHDRLLRPAMVFVAMPASRPASEAEDDASAAGGEASG